MAAEPQRLADLSGDAFAAITSAHPVILLPLGSHEDHGPHLPMGDYVLAEILANRIAVDCTTQGIATVATPALPFGVADYFGSTPGGMALSAATFRGVLTDLLDGFRRHSLDRIIILNGHGGNVPVIHEVTLSIKRAHGVVIPSFYLWKIARSLLQRRLGGGHAEQFGHGKEPLLSLSYALRPGLVSQGNTAASAQSHIMDLPVSGFGTAAFAGVEIDVPMEFDQVPQDYKAAPSLELGNHVAQDLVELAVKFVKHYAQTTA